MGDVHIYTGHDPRLTEALDRLEKLEDWQVALVDEFRQRAEHLRNLEASVAEAFKVVRERLSTLETSNMDAEAMKAELGTIGKEMDESLTDIGGIVTANTEPAPQPLAEGARPQGPIPVGTPGVA